MRRLAAALLLLAGTAACTAGTTPPPSRAEVCAWYFARYDTAVRVYGTPSIDEDFGLVPPAPLSRWIEGLRRNGCVTTSSELDGLQALAARLAPYRIDNSGPALRRPVPIHLGIVTNFYDQGRVSEFVRGLGYRTRSVGAETLGRRIYIGPFTTQSAVDQALAVAREAGFIAPYVAEYTKF
jgi:hypothetical protein